MINKTTFNKKPLSVKDQILILQGRGLIVDNIEEAEDFLQQVIYYRFSGYALNFEIFEKRKRTHLFKPNTTFSQIIRLYEFDTSLRKLLFKYIEPIETSFRSVFCLEMALKYDNAHWYLDPELFHTKFNHSKFIKSCEKEIERSREIFIKKYNEKYDDPKLPASWMILEILSFGNVSNLYSKLKKREDTKLIANYFDCSPQEMSKWIHSICVLRNACAHHSRIWNKSSHIIPRLSRKKKPDWLKHDNRRISSLCFVVYQLLKPLNKAIKFQEEFSSLLSDFSEINIEKMGFPKDWNKVFEKTNHFPFLDLRINDSDCPSDVSSNVDKYLYDE